MFQGKLLVGGGGSGKCEVTALFEVVAVAVAAASVRVAAETVEATAAEAVMVVEKAQAVGAANLMVVPTIFCLQFTVVGCPLRVGCSGSVRSVSVAVAVVGRSGSGRLQWLVAVAVSVAVIGRSGIVHCHHRQRSYRQFWYTVCSWWRRSRTNFFVYISQMAVSVSY